MLNDLKAIFALNYLYILYLISFFLVHLCSFLFVRDINDDCLTANTRVLLDLTFSDNPSYARLHEFWGLKQNHKVFCIRNGEKKTAYEKEKGVWGEPKKRPQTMIVKDLLLLLLFSSDYTFILCSAFNSILWYSGIVDPHFFF